MNTAAHTAGRVCFPNRHDAMTAIFTGRRSGYPGASSTRAQWWPGAGSLADVPRTWFGLLELTQRDYVQVEGPR